MKKLIIPILLTFSLLIFFLFYHKLARPENEDNDKTIGEIFHEKTSLDWWSVVKSVAKKTPAKPSSFKFYGNKKKIPLPAPEFKGSSVEEALKKRRSVRNYSKKEITLKELSILLFSAQGITGEEGGIKLRTSPSAGALYPIEIYIVVNRVEGIKKGIYHYNVLEHALELLKEGDFGGKLASASISQQMPEDAGANFIITAIFDRVRWKYDERGFRYAYIEAGHISQNIYLQTTSLGLAGVEIGAFFDKKVCDIIAIDCKKEAPLLIHSVGKR